MTCFTFSLCRLASVYVQANADVKRTILRLIDIPIRTMGMQSPELLKLVETCPKGAETLVTKIIHILTDKGNISIISFNLLFFFY